VRPITGPPENFCPRSVHPRSTKGTAGTVPRRPCQIEIEITVDEGEDGWGGPQVQGSARASAALSSARLCSTTWSLSRSCCRASLAAGQSPGRSTTKLGQPSRRASSRNYSREPSARIKTAS